MEIVDRRMIFFIKKMFKYKYKMLVELNKMKLKKIVNTFSISILNLTDNWQPRHC